MAVCTTKTAILSGGQQVVVPVDSRVHVGPVAVGHGQPVVRVGHRAQALLQLVALSALRPRPPHRLRRAAAAAADAATDAAADSSEAAAAAESRAPAVRAGGQRRAEREVAAARSGRRFQSGRQAHAVYLNQRRVFHSVFVGRRQRTTTTKQQQ